MGGGAVLEAPPANRVLSLLDKELNKETMSVSLSLTMYLSSFSWLLLDYILKKIVDLSDAN